MHLLSVAQFHTPLWVGLLLHPPRAKRGIGQLTRGAFRIKDLLWKPHFSLGYAALLWTTRLFLSSKVEKILACSSEHLSKWKKEDSKQLGPFFESASKHKHLCMSDILICLSVVLFWREQNIFSLLSAVQLNFNFYTKFQTLCQRKKY